MATILFKTTRAHKLTSKYRGVCWDKRKKQWKSCIRISGVQKVLGWFDDPTQAAAEYNREAIRVHGAQFAVLNILED